MVKFPFSRESEYLLKNALSNDKVIVFPTETFYGIGGNAFSMNLVEKIYKIKGRSRAKSLLLLTNLEWLDQICFWKDLRIDDLMKNFWPGPLTLILNAKKELPKHLQNNNKSVAIRYSSSNVVNRLIELGNCPIIGTSANLSGMPECSSVREAGLQLNSKVDLYIDGGTIPKKKPSTILDCQKHKFELLRHGAISLSKLNQICEISNNE